MYVNIGNEFKVLVRCLLYFIIIVKTTGYLQGGIYIFQLADWYFASFALLVGSFLETIGICWFYGMQNPITKTRLYSFDTLKF